MSEADRSHTKQVIGSLIALTIPADRDMIREEVIESVAPRVDAAAPSGARR